jgi:hypothetical protein
MNKKDYDNARDKLRAFNMERMGSGEWLQWFINISVAQGRRNIVAPDGVYLIQRPIYIPYISARTHITVLGTVYAET